MYGGLLEGYRTLEQTAGAANKHIFLLSDGVVNAGPIQGTADIISAVSEWQEKIPILSYGIGDDFNEQLMSPLGQVHRGSHYFYITDAASVERLVGKGVKALTGAVARNVRLDVEALTGGLWFPDSMIEGNTFALVRERSVLQFLVEVDVRPEVAANPNTAVRMGGFCSRRATAGRAPALRFAWKIKGLPALERSHGHVALTPTTDRALRQRESQEVRTFLDVRRACDLRRTATSSENPRKTCEEALRLFESRLDHDRFGFAQEWALKTRQLLEDGALWAGQAACAGAAKHLGVALARPSGDEDEEEEDMDFDLFG